MPACAIIMATLSANVLAKLRDDPDYSDPITLQVYNSSDPHAL